MTLPPRRSDNVTGVPVSSGSVKSGAVSPGSSRPLIPSPFLHSLRISRANLPRARLSTRRTAAVVREAGLEPAHPKAPEPKSGASASSATRARGHPSAVTPRRRVSPVVCGPDRRRERLMPVLAPGEELHPGGLLQRPLDVGQHIDHTLRELLHVIA